MTELNGLDPRTKAITSAVGEQLKRFAAEAAGREKLLLDRLDGYKQELSEVKSKSVEDSQARVRLLEHCNALSMAAKDLHRRTEDHAGVLECVKALLENRAPIPVHNEVKSPEVHVEFKAPDIIPPSVVVKAPDVVNQNNIESPQIFVSVDMTPVAKALGEFKDVMQSFVEVIKEVRKRK